MVGFVSGHLVILWIEWSTVYCPSVAQYTKLYKASLRITCVTCMPVCLMTLIPTHLLLNSSLCGSYIDRFSSVYQQIAYLRSFPYFQLLALYITLLVNVVASKVAERVMIIIRDYNYTDLHSDFICLQTLLAVFNEKT